MPPATAPARIPDLDSTTSDTGGQRQLAAQSPLPHIGLAEWMRRKCINLVVSIRKEYAPDATRVVAAFSLLFALVIIWGL